MKNVMVVYGGVTPEHDVAVVTALQVMNALKEGGFNVMPLYISKGGSWHLGNEKFLRPESYKNTATLLKESSRVVLTPDPDYKLLKKGWLSFGFSDIEPDVVFPVIHGRGGEDGTLQGLLELSGIPYVGCGVTTSAIKIDKFIAKKVAKTCGMDVLEDLLLIKGEELTKVQRGKLKYPVMVKPVGMGSSIGLTKVDKDKDLDAALEVAFCYDTRVMIEEGLTNFAEVNISILGNGPEYQLSMTEQPVSSGAVLSFADKYEGQSRQKGMAGAKRLIPAGQKTEVIKKIERHAKEFFRTVGGRGIARIDFMVSDKGKIYFNEINTMPGSLAFYLWEASGLSFKKLVTRLVEMAVEESMAKKSLISTFESNILSGFASRGLKGGKV